ncbi:MAG: hypothetical protein J2O38_00900, partial [Acidimicrobiales bacterium]|nr:hypothetical protein [Acidimicrobiales bacterium]
RKRLRSILVPGLTIGARAWRQAPGGDRVGSRLYSPFGSFGRHEASLAPRTGDLHGGRLGLLDNTKPNANRLLDEVGALLEQKLAPAQLVRRVKPTMSLPGPDALLDELAAQCDAVVVAVGD